MSCEMSTETIERPRTGGPGSGLGAPWKVVVMNDDHNTFEGVAMALSRVLPSTTMAKGYEFANKIHFEGRATVWAGPLEPAELFWELLCDSGLTMAPLVQG